MDSKDKEIGGNIEVYENENDENNDSLENMLDAVGRLVVYARLHSNQIQFF